MFEPLPDAPEDHDGDHVWFFVRGTEVLVADTAEGARPLAHTEAVEFHHAAGDHLVLGRFEGALYWTATLSHEFEPPDGFTLTNPRALFSALSDTHWNVVGRATQISDWYRDHQFCGRCGAPMQRLPGERAMRCPEDANVSYPRLSPAVIVLVERDDGRALLARNARWPMPMYSTLAGFVEPGESLEDTLHREVREEVGIEITNPRYFGSQPWPFPNSLMLGFTVDYAGGEIVVDEVEISEAAFYGLDDLPPLPPKPSIARALIDAWLERVRTAG